MPSEPLLAGIYDPRGTLAADRARDLVGAALAFYDPGARIERWGPLTVGLAGGGPSTATGSSPVSCMLEGAPRLDGAPVGEREIASAWRREGDALLSRLRGSFLLVLWDDEAGRGIAARDQMGQRPLLFHTGGSRLAFAGDVRPVLGLVTPRPGPDETAVACWLGLRARAGDGTMFEGVRRLPGGHLIELGPGPFEPRTYWRPRYREPIKGAPDELLAGMVEHMERATAALVDGAQAPGVLLSGGIDSTSVTALASPLARQAGKPLRTYSATFPDLPDADESHLVNDLVGALGLQNTSMQVHGGSLLSGVLAYTDASHMPDIAANNFFSIELLRLAAREGVDVLLDGEGGDELFLVPRYLLADLLVRGKLGAVRNLLQFWPNIAGNQSRRFRLRMVRRYGLGGLVPHGAERAWWLLRPRPSVLELTRSAERAARRASDPAAWKGIDGPRWWAQLAYHMTAGPDSFGAPEHALRIARMAGVRRRRPLLDLDLSEYVLQLPPNLAFSPWYTKAHIRRAMLDRVPESILFQRKKTVFSDVRSRSLEPDVAFAMGLLGSGAEVRRFIRPEAIEQTLAGPPAGADEMTRATWGFKLQHLAGTELWLRVQADPSISDELRSQAGFTPLRYDLVRREP